MNPIQQAIEVEDIRAAGGIVHSDGNIFFTNIDQLRTAVAAALGRGVVNSGWCVTSEELAQWTDAYAAFKGAFDTPQMRRQFNDEYAEDSRHRLREFNERMLSAAPSPEATQPATDVDLINRGCRHQTDLLTVATQPTQAEAPSEREAREMQEVADKLREAGYHSAANNTERTIADIKSGNMPRAVIGAALATQQVGQGEPVAFEFYNPTTGHAIVDYSRQTHVGPLTKEMGYEARALGYINPPPAAVKPGDPVPLWQALEALDSLEESSRGDAPYNHFAAGLVRSALEQSATPPAPGHVERDREDAENWRYIRRKLCLTGNGDGTCAMQAVNLPAAIQGWPESGQVAEFCDAAIRAARSSEGGSNEHSR